MIEYLLWSPDRETFIAVMAALQNPVTKTPLAEVIEGNLIPSEFVRIDEIGDVVRQAPWFSQAAAVVVAGKSRPMSAQYGQVSDILRTTTSAVLARTKTPAEGVDEIDARLRRLMR